MPVKLRRREKTIENEPFDINIVFKYESLSKKEFETKIKNNTKKRIINEKNEEKKSNSKLNNNKINNNNNKTNKQFLNKKRNLINDEEEQSITSHSSNNLTDFNNFNNSNFNEDSNNNDNKETNSINEKKEEEEEKKIMFSEIGKKLINFYKRKIFNENELNEIVKNYKEQSEIIDFLFDFITNNYNGDFDKIYINDEFNDIKINNNEISFEEIKKIYDKFLNNYFNYLHSKNRNSKFLLLSEYTPLFNYLNDEKKSLYALIPFNISLKNTKFDLTNIIKQIQNKNLIQIDDDNHKNIINSYYFNDNNVVYNENNNNNDFFIENNNEKEKNISINNHNFNNFNGVIKLNLENYPDLNNEFEKIIKKNEIFSITNKSINKYLPLKLSGISSKNLYIFNNKSSINLTEFFIYNENKTYNSQFRKILLNLSKNSESIIYHFIITKNTKKINFTEQYNNNSNNNSNKDLIDLIYNLNVPFYFIKQKPGELLIIEPETTLISFIKEKEDKNEYNKNFILIEFNTGLIDNINDIKNFYEKNNKYNNVPIINTFIQIINNNLNNLSLDIIKYLKTCLLTYFDKNEDLNFIKDFIINKKINIIQKFNKNFFCYECNKEVVNYYTNYNNKFYCLNCSLKFIKKINVIYEKFNNFEITKLFNRLNKFILNEYKNEKIIDNKQECFDFNIYKNNNNFNKFNDDEIIKNENFEFDIIKKINYNKINRFCIPAIIGQQKNSFVCYNSNDFDKRKNIGEMEIDIDELNIKNENLNNSKLVEKNNLSLIVRKEIKKNVYDEGNFVKKNNISKKNNINNNNNNVNNNNLVEEKKLENNNKKKGILFTDLY